MPFRSISIAAFVAISAITTTIAARISSQVIPPKLDMIEF